MKAVFLGPTTSGWVANILIIVTLALGMGYVYTAMELKHLEHVYSSYRLEADDHISVLTRSIDVMHRRADFVKNETECLAKNIYFEARGEEEEGMVAVAQVTANRVNDERYPKTYCSVVYQRSQSGCQFSWTCDGQRDAILDKSAYNKALDISKKFLLKNMRSSIIGDDVLFYHAEYVDPVWNQQMAAVTTIGKHVFYKYGE